MATGVERPRRPNSPFPRPNRRGRLRLRVEQDTREQIAAEKAERAAEERVRAADTPERDLLDKQPVPARLWPSGLREGP